MADASLLLDVISGPDERDATSSNAPAETDFAAAVDTDIAGMTVGVPTQLLEGADPAVRHAFDAAMAELEEAGAAVEEIELASLEHAVAAYYVLAMSEASSNLARYDGVRYGTRADASGDWNEQFAATRSDGFGEEVIRRILLGTFALSAGYHDKYYEQAQAARAWITAEFRDAFEAVDAIASPTMPVTPFRLGETIDDPLQMYLADANTVPVNLANVPAISVPIGDVDGLPVGAQVIGPQWCESTLIGIGATLERGLA